MKNVCEDCENYKPQVKTGKYELEPVRFLLKQFKGVKSSLSFSNLCPKELKTKILCEECPINYMGLCSRIDNAVNDTIDHLEDLEERLEKEVEEAE